ncbi:MAG: hypothetical protein JWN45_1660 [Acidobacteriaceae bacterium]|nr:hypothetical protein [Acidobacteriaceae bacterium]
MCGTEPALSEVEWALGYIFIFVIQSALSLARRILRLALCNLLAVIKHSRPEQNGCSSEGQCLCC